MAGLGLRLPRRTGATLRSPARAARIGRDLAGRPPAPARARSLAILLAAGFAAAVLLAGLRIEIVRLRYALAESVQAVQRNDSALRALRVRVRELRGPHRLRAQAAAAGFGQPDRLIEVTPAPSHARSASQAPIAQRPRSAARATASTRASVSRREGLP